MIPRYLSLRHLNSLSSSRYDGELAGRDLSMNETPSITFDKFHLSQLIFPRVIFVWRFLSSATMTLVWLLGGGNGLHLLGHLGMFLPTSPLEALLQSFHALDPILHHSTILFCNLKVRISSRDTRTKNTMASSGPPPNYCMRRRGPRHGESRICADVPQMSSWRSRSRQRHNRSVTPTRSERYAYFPPRKSAFALTTLITEPL